ncbi:hypothetical protein LEMLEM_LOCUS15954, partial [Lemmus lemmus]
GGSKRTGKFWKEESSFCSPGPATEEARCDCFAEKRCMMKMKLEQIKKNTLKTLETVTYNWRLQVPDCSQKAYLPPSHLSGLFLTSTWPALCTYISFMKKHA